MISSNQLISIANYNQSIRSNGLGQGSMFMRSALIERKISSLYKD